MENKTTQGPEGEITPEALRLARHTLTERDEKVRVMGWADHYAKREETSRIIVARALLAATDRIAALESQLAQALEANEYIQVTSSQRVYELAEQLAACAGEREAEMGEPSESEECQTEQVEDAIQPWRAYARAQSQARALLALQLAQADAETKESDEQIALLTNANRRLAEENARLLGEVDRWKKAFSGLDAHTADLDNLAALEAENARLKAELAQVGEAEKP